MLWDLKISPGLMMVGLFHLQLAGSMMVGLFQLNIFGWDIGCGINCINIGGANGGGLNDDWFISNWDGFI